jgi:hypothetical protein
MRVLKLVTCSLDGAKRVRDRFVAYDRVIGGGIKHHDVR